MLKLERMRSIVGTDKLEPLTPTEQSIGSVIYDYLAIYKQRIIGGTLKFTPDRCTFYVHVPGSGPYRQVRMDYTGSTQEIAVLRRLTTQLREFYNMNIRELATDHLVIRDEDRFMDFARNCTDDEFEDVMRIHLFWYVAIVLHAFELKFDAEVFKEFEDFSRLDELCTYAAQAWEDGCQFHEIAAQFAA